MVCPDGQKMATHPTGSSHADRFQNSDRTIHSPEKSLPSIGWRLPCCCRSRCWCLPSMDMEAPQQESLRQKRLRYNEDSCVSWTLLEVRGIWICHWCRWPAAWPLRGRPCRRDSISSSSESKDDYE